LSDNVIEMQCFPFTTGLKQATSSSLKYFKATNPVF